VRKEEVEAVLTKVLDIVLATAPEVDFRLVGTASSVLRGIDLPAGDIDILLREQRGVDLFGEALASAPGIRCRTAPTHLLDAGQYFAEYDVDGSRVELSTMDGDWAADLDSIECLGKGPWQHFDRLVVGRYEVPVVATELRLLTELGRERPDRYRPILWAMTAGSNDSALLNRGLERLEIPTDRRAEILANLTAGNRRA